MSNKGDGNRPKKTGGAGWQAFLNISQLGVNMGVCIVGGFWVGHKLDAWLDTSPWLLIIFTLLGVGAAFKVMFDISLR